MDQGLPIFVKKTTPKIEETFWINVIGRVIPCQTALLGGARIGLKFDQQALS